MKEHCLLLFVFLLDWLVQETEDSHIDRMNVYVTAKKDDPTCLRS